MRTSETRWVDEGEYADPGIEFATTDEDAALIRAELDREAADQRAMLLLTHGPLALEPVIDTIDLNAIIPF